MKEGQKRLMLLGGLRYLIPLIQAAHKAGYYVITCDYLPENIAHKYSDEYCNVSIIDKEAVLQAAKEKKIDGIMSFAVDPGVTTAAYVQEQLGLPGNPYRSVLILQNKDRFRKFLSDNGFNTPAAYSFDNLEDAIKSKETLPYPMIVKPTDSAGSKGVTKVENAEMLEEAARYAFQYSHSGNIIIEQFIEKAGCSSDSDCFSVDGELRFVSFSAQRFDDNAANPYTPSAYSWPSTMTSGQEEYLKAEIQRLLTLLDMRTSIYNIETRIGLDGKAYIMEVSPRGGGNRLSEMLRYATGTDLIENAIRAAVGDPVTDLEQRPYDGHWAEIILHADESGRFEDLQIAEDMKKYVVETDLWVAKGESVESFNGANNAIGTLVMKFESDKMLRDSLSDIASWMKVVVE